MDEQNISGLLESLRDAFPAGGATIRAPASLGEVLRGELPNWQFTDEGGDADAHGLVLESPLSPLDIASLDEAFARCGTAKFAFVRYRIAGMPAEAVEEALAAVEERYVLRGAPPTAEFMSWLSVCRRMPRAWLFLGSSQMGKTSAIRDLARRSGLAVVHGDGLIRAVAKGELAVGHPLRDAIGDASHLGVSIRAVFTAGLFGELADHIAGMVGQQDFCFEMYVPGTGRARVAEEFRRRGYFVFMPGADLLSERAREASLLAQSETKIDHLRAELAELRASTSWRLTAPLRWLKRRLTRPSP